MIKLVYPVDKPLNRQITLPGSKYLANRLLILATLSNSKSSLSNMPHNEDIKAAISGLTQLGAKFQWHGNTLHCQGMDSQLQQKDLFINSCDSGSFSRFVLPILALSEQLVTLSGSNKMNSRPMEELFRVLEQLGATIISAQQTPAMTLPVQIKGPVRGGSIVMSGDISSQYISALLMTAGKLTAGLKITLTANPVSKPYLRMTLALLKLFNINVESDKELRNFTILPGQQYLGIEYQLESDPSSASYFFAAAAISSGHVCISNFHPERSIQGEARFVTVLQSMGCKIWQDFEGFHCQGPVELQAVDVDMGDMPDVVQTLSVVAMFAKGTTVITNIANLAFKESNRIEDTALEIRKTGINVTTSNDSITIEGGEPGSATLDTHDDHRMAMSLALIALKVDDIKIRDESVVAKSFPDYWQYLEQLGYALYHD